MTFCSKNEKETEALGRRLAAFVSPGTVIALYGGMGAGKTAFVRGLAAGMGLAARVSSPTFTIVNEYLGETPLFHFDMYRLSDADELFNIGWEDYLTRGGALAVEWSENVDGVFDGSEIRVRIGRGENEDERIIEVENLPDSGGRENENTCT